VGQIVDNKLTIRKAEDVLRAIGVKISDSVLVRGASTHRQSGATSVATPAKAGIDAILPKEALEKLRVFVRALRAMNIKVGRSLVLGTVNLMILGTNVTEKFKEKEARDGWYKSWKRMNGFRKEASIKRIELSRAKWCTAKNIKLYAAAPSSCEYSQLYRTHRPCCPHVQVV
jgi:hypothetical protein